MKGMVLCRPLTSVLALPWHIISILFVLLLFYYLDPFVHVLCYDWQDCCNVSPISVKVSLL